MYKPSLEEVKKLAGQSSLVPIYRELPADLETPVSVYLKLQDEGPSFLLESITGGQNVARYSFIGVRPQALLTTVDNSVIISTRGSQRSIPLTLNEDPLSVLKNEMARYKPAIVPGLPPFTGGAVGYLSYDVVRRFEKLPNTAQPAPILPEAAFMLTDALVAFDHVRQRLLIIANAYLTGDVTAAYRRAVARIDEIIARLQAPLNEPLPENLNGGSGSTPQIPLKTDMVSNFSRDKFTAAVNRAKEYITAGDIFQVVLSQRFSRTTQANPFDIYRSLRRLNPSPYMVFMRFPGGLGTEPLHIIAASPEMQVRLDGDTAELRPIAGTRPRGNTPAEDVELTEELLADEKERAEHVMLVDLGRNDLGRVCEYGSVRVEEMMNVEKYSHVMHIVSDVRGRLEKGRDAFDLLRATFPAGTVSGAPKIRAMEIIEELEGVRRGLYAGVMGYVDYAGNMDSCITIRTLIMQGNTLHIQSGCGIVADSIPDREYEEIINKARALNEAIKSAEQIN